MPKSPFEAMRIVSIDRKPMDPAIDPEKSNFLEYRLTRKLDSLVFHEGKSPVYCDVQKMPRRVLRGPIAGLERTPHLQRQLAFKIACHQIERADGSKLECDPKWLDEGIGGTQVANEDWLDAVSNEFGEDLIDEIGRVAVEFAKLPEGQHGPFSLQRS